MMSLRLELSKGAVLQATTPKAFVWRPRLTGVIDTPWVVTGTEPKGSILRRHIELACSRGEVNAVHEFQFS